MFFPSPSGLREYYSRIPTTDLYVLNPIRHLRRTGKTLPAAQHVAGNVYTIGRTGIVSRYASREELGLLEARHIDRIVYVADDDFEAGASDAALPEKYRSRLAAFVEGPWGALKDAADVVLVPNNVLGEIYGAKARIVPPVWHRPPADLDHFQKTKRIEIAHLGTGSHHADLLPLAPSLAGILDANPAVRLTLFSGLDAPEALRGHGQVRSRRAMPWWLYKSRLPRMRFHLAIYPLRESAFNAARSANKLYEHALVGATSLMSSNAALREAAGDDLAALFIEGGAEEWRHRILEAVSEPAACRRRAEDTRAHILASHPASGAASQWFDMLEGES